MSARFVGERQPDTHTHTHVHSTHKKLSKFLAFYLFAYACDNFIYVSARLSQKKQKSGILGEKTWRKDVEMKLKRHFPQHFFLGCQCVCVPLNQFEYVGEVERSR